MPLIRVAIGEHGDVVGQHHHRARYSDATVSAVRSLAEDGLTNSAIAKRLGLPLRWVRAVVAYERRAIVARRFRITTKIQEGRLEALR